MALAADSAFGRKKQLSMFDLTMLLAKHLTELES